jgi:uncharacterized protein (TIGR02600 family)
MKWNNVPSRRHAIALVVVLMVLALMTVLMVSLMSGAAAEKRASTSQSQTLAASKLADTAINIVISQIRRSTSRTDAIWASQPGAIRSYLTDGGFRGYKLYSDPSLVVEDESLLVSDLPVINWKSDSARWVDLNVPAIQNNETYYPIVDPSSATVEGTSPSAPASVDWFPTTFPGLSIKTTAPDWVKEEPHTLPMPVEWLYVLQDGSFGSLDDTGEIVGANASLENPVIGRIAFWTDDECAKININTASEPTPWDVPRAGNANDRDFAQFQPSTKEYARFPGHPATTALSDIMLRLPSVTFDSNRDVRISRRIPAALAKSQLYAILPRIQPRRILRGHLGSQRSNHCYTGQRSIVRIPG